MPLTSLQRSAINRQNASHSTGPKTDDGKTRSRRNALKHGLRAEALALPNEDPAAVAARNDSWNDYYKPQSPAAQHLVNQCVQATLLADRCNQFHHAALSAQIRETQMLSERREHDELQEMILSLDVDPRETLARMVRNGPGLRHLIACWKRLRETLEDKRHWTPSERDEAIRLQGFHPHLNAPIAWITRLYCLICDRLTPREQIDAMFAPDFYPEMFHDLCSPDSLPDVDTCLAWLRDIVFEQLDSLRALETNHRTRYEEPARAEAAALSLILNNPVDARLFLRYHSESRNAFHRAYRELVKTLEADALSPVEDDSPNEPNAPEPPPPSPAETVSPNEPKSSVKPEKYVPYEPLERLLRERPAPVGYLTVDDERPRMYSGLCPDENLGGV